MEDNNKLIIESDKPVQVVSDHAGLKEESRRIIRGKEQRIKSEKASVTARKDGTITTASGLYSQKKNNSALLQSEELGIKDHIVTNQFMVESDDIVLDMHKLNRKLIDDADYVPVLKSEYTGEGGIAGRFMISGTILTRSWDHSLQKYVLIRRPVYMPMFSPQLVIGEVMSGLKITPSTDIMEKYMGAYKESGLSLKDFLKKETDSLADVKKSDTQGKAVGDKTEKDNKDVSPK